MPGRVHPRLRSNVFPPTLVHPRSVIVGSFVCVGSQGGVTRVCEGVYTKTSPRHVDDAEVVGARKSVHPDPHQLETGSCHPLPR